MGSVYRDMNDSPRAVTNYLKAIEIAEKSEDADPALMQVSYLQLSGIYQKQFKHNEALDLALKGLKIAERQGKATERTFMNVATTYFNIGDTLNTISLCDKTMDIILNNGVCKKNADIVSKALYYYTRANNEKDATLCHNLLKSLPHNELPRNYAPNLAIYYEKFVSEDSAAAIFRKLYDTTDRIGSKYDASLWLTKHYNDKGDYEQASKYAVRFIEANRAVVENMDYEYTNNAKNLFQYQRDKEEEQRIMLESEQKSKMLIIIIASTFIIILFITTLYFRYRRRMLARLVSMNVRVAELGNEILRKEKEISEMGEKVDELDRQKDLMERKIREQKLKNGDLVKLLMTKDSRDDDSGIVDYFKSAATGKCSVGDSEWDRLYDYVSSKYPDFAHELQCESVRINSTTLRLYCMLKIGLTNREIENITGWPHQTVWYRVKRIEKVFNGNVVG